MLQIPTYPQGVLTRSMIPPQKQQLPLHEDEPVIVHYIFKDEYLKIVKERRRDLVHKHFSRELDRFFDEVKQDANNMKILHREVTFTVPEPFDVDKIESLLSNYFTDMGYKALAEPRTKDSNKIRLTIT